VAVGSRRWGRDGALSGPTDRATSNEPDTSPERPAFAHASEAELGRILDFYEVRWEYEPHVYPIRWSLDGDVLESFSPDFYLPDLDLYLEITTLKQRLVRKKNRKLRRLRELYPDLRVKLFYARDFRALMLKYGKLAIADALSGTDGQLGVPHPADPPKQAPASAVAEPVGGATTVRRRSSGRAVTVAVDPAVGGPR
jgi:hypothetical protein